VVGQPPAIWRNALKWRIVCTIAAHAARPHADTRRALAENTVPMMRVAQRGQSLEKATGLSSSKRDWSEQSDTVLGDGHRDGVYGGGSGAFL
jgi:hypothetical protein